jgi:hypothetical protein
MTNGWKAMASPLRSAAAQFLIPLAGPGWHHFKVVQADPIFKAAVNGRSAGVLAGDTRPANRAFVASTPGCLGRGPARMKVLPDVLGMQLRKPKHFYAVRPRIALACRTDLDKY